eukprot:m.11232 g.11232  ORF g.11232 m.11232 type:complete len:301 (+) comp3139_c0_seq2:29-931(+)
MRPVDARLELMLTDAFCLGLVSGLLALNLYPSPSCSELGDVGLVANCKYLRLVNLSQNLITSLDVVSGLKELISLDASHNRLETAAIDELPLLQSLNLSNNRIENAEGIVHPSLRKLCLSGNRISELFLPAEVAQLMVLEASKNQLTKFPTISVCSQLSELHLNENGITALPSEQTFPALKILQLADNKLASLRGISCFPVLEEFDVSRNLIESPEEIEHLGAVAGTLSRAVFGENPVTGETDYRLCVLVICTHLQLLDNQEIEDMERDEAEEVRRLRKAERKNLESEKRQNEGTEEIVE